MKFNKTVSLFIMGIIILAMIWSGIAMVVATGAILWTAFGGGW